MPAGPAPTMTTSTLSPAPRSFGHCVVRRERGRPCSERITTPRSTVTSSSAGRRAVDLDEALEAHAHQVVRRARRATHGRRAKPLDTRRQQGRKATLAPAGTRSGRPSNVMATLPRLGGGRAIPEIDCQ